MEVQARTTDPLHLLPSEIVLRILEYASISSLANLLQVGRDWKHFIEENEEHIYYSPSKTQHPPGSKDFAFLREARNFTKYFADVSSWKELCKRQTLLDRNWTSEQPSLLEYIVRVEPQPIWRFRPDFKRRFFLSTAQVGGLSVTDFDTRRRLWGLNADGIRPFAHLEYQDGTAVWDREGNALEVWRTDLEGLERGQFRQIAVLPHECQTRGFQLSYDTLCVVSCDGVAFVYDMIGTPKLRTKIQIEPGAVGHLDQGPDVVTYSLGNNGYHFYDKTSGEQLGILSPKTCTDVYHIIHPPAVHTANVADANLLSVPDRTTPIEVEVGPYPVNRPDMISLEDDEWGAGVLDGDLFVGISRGGRTLVCPNWRKALSNTGGRANHISMIECDSDGSTHEFGGWLSVRNHRIMFEIRDRIYIVGLTDGNAICTSDTSRPSISCSTGISPEISTPVSFMALYDDCIMSTFTTLRNHITIAGNRHVRTKVIRVLSFAPGDSNEAEDITTVPGAEAQRGYIERMINAGVHPFLAAVLDPEAIAEMMEETEDGSLAVEVDEESELEALD